MNTLSLGEQCIRASEQEDLLKDRIYDELIQIFSVDPTNSDSWPCTDITVYRSHQFGNVLDIKELRHGLKVTPAIEKMLYALGFDQVAVYYYDDDDLLQVAVYQKGVKSMEISTTKPC